MVGYDDEMYYHCLGTISELFDGNPPFHGRGGISFAMNVAEVLRTQHLLKNYGIETQPDNMENNGNNKEQERRNAQ
jgi:hypothetical protein